MAFDGIRSNHDEYRHGKHRIKKFYKSLREHAMQIINFETKKFVPLTNEKYELYIKQINCYICKNKFEHKYTDNKDNCKVKDYCHYTGQYRGSTHSICNLKYSIPKEIAKEKR